MVVDITLSPHPLSSPTLPPIDKTMINLVLELGALPTRQSRAPRICRVLHPLAPSAPLASSAPSALSAPLAPFEIARDRVDQLVVYFRCRPKRNINTPSYGTH